MVCAQSALFNSSRSIRCVNAERPSHTHPFYNRLLQDLNRRYNQWNLFWNHHPSKLRRLDRIHGCRSGVLALHIKLRLKRQVHLNYSFQCLSLRMLQTTDLVRPVRKNRKIYIRKELHKLSKKTAEKGLEINVKIALHKSL